jgi:hypothetical protein
MNVIEKYHNYKIRCTAYFLLKLFISPFNFTVKINKRNGKFQDISITIRNSFLTNSHNKSYFLKQVEEHLDYTFMFAVIPNESDDGEIGDLTVHDLNQYSVSVVSPKKKIVIYTNKKIKYDPIIDDQFYFSNGFLIEEEMPPKDLFNTKPGAKLSVLRFKRRTRNCGRQIPWKEMQIYSEQKNGTELEKSIEDIFKEKIYCTDEQITYKYLELIEKIADGKFEDNFISKNTLNYCLMELLIGEFVCSSDFNLPNHKEICKALKNHLYIDIEDTPLLDSLEYSRFLDVWELCFLKLAKKYKFVEKFETTLNEYQKYKMCCYFFKEPFIVECKNNNLNLLCNKYFLLENKINYLIFTRRGNIGQIVEKNNLSKPSLNEKTIEVPNRNFKFYWEKILGMEINWIASTRTKFVLKVVWEWK